MQVDHDFQAGISGPHDGLVQNWELALHEGVAVDWGNSPVSDRDPDVIHASGRNLVEIILGDPCFPVVRKAGCRFCLAESLGISVFVDHCRC